jgi:glycosyltransferase involved in cell wall biosynthesis
MNICLIGLDNLPVLAPEYRHHTVGGESVQQTLLARALARRGHDVSMVVADHGQPDGARWGPIRVFKAYRPGAGLPVLRFVHPRWTGLWSAASRADADIYYTSCAGMQVGLLALFCHRYGKQLVFRTASDADCDRSRLLVRFARDRWLYAYGLQRADAILVQSAAQAEGLWRSYGLSGRVARMLVDAPQPAASRDIDLLWVSNIRHEKRPDRILDLATTLAEASIHMVGGPLPGARRLFQVVRDTTSARANVVFHGPLSYWDASDLYGRAKVLVNTSDVEGFPNSYLQAWIRGVPVVTLIDPDGVIEREGLGIAVRSPTSLPGAIRHLLGDATAWRAASDRCRGFMAREYAEDKVLATYVETFEDVMRLRRTNTKMIAAHKARHV